MTDLAATLMAFFWGTSCAHGALNQSQLEVVPSVDINRYLGTWFEIARYPNSFQGDCFASTATYSLRGDGNIKVINRCNEGSFDGPIDEAVGKAWVVDPSTNAKLKVQFFWPFAGNYWIIDLDPNYQWAVVGEPDRQYLWILSRTPQMDKNDYEGIISRLTPKGYDPQELISTPQKETL